MNWIKIGFRYLLAFILASVFCAILIVSGNDLLSRFEYAGSTAITVLELNYGQWLPVSALLMGLTFVLYLFALKQLFPKLKTIWLALISGSIALLLALCFHINHLLFNWGNWYEVKNAIVIFLSGFSLAAFAELLD